MKADADLRFEDFEQWLKANLQEGQKYDTLGGRSQFSADINAQDILHIRSSTGEDYYVPREHRQRVFSRFRYLCPPKRFETAQYENNNKEWPECPNRNTSPWVARVIKFWAETDP